MEKQEESWEEFRPKILDEILKHSCCHSPNPILVNDLNLKFIRLETDSLITIV